MLSGRGVVAAFIGDKTYNQLRRLMMGSPINGGGNEGKKTTTPFHSTRNSIPLNFFFFVSFRKWNEKNIITVIIVKTSLVFNTVKMIEGRMSEPNEISLLCWMLKMFERPKRTVQWMKWIAVLAELPAFEGIDGLAFSSFCGLGAASLRQATSPKKRRKKANNPSIHSTKEESKEREQNNATKQQAKQ